MTVQPDIWMALAQWKADNQKWNNLPRWQVDRFSEVSPRTRPDQVLAWLGRNLTTLGIWLQNRYGDTCLIQPDANPQTSR